MRRRSRPIRLGPSQILGVIQYELRSAAPEFHPFGSALIFTRLLTYISELFRSLDKPPFAKSALFVGYQRITETVYRLGRHC